MDFGTDPPEVAHIMLGVEQFLKGRQPPRLGSSVPQGLASSLIPPLARRLVMPLWGQRLAFGLRPELLTDLVQHHYTGTEGIPIVLNNLGQLPDQRVCLFICEFK